MTIIRESERYMKLYTINATPVMTQEQYDTVADTLGHYYRRGATLEEVNGFNCENYALEVSDVMRRYGVDGFTIYEVVGYWQGVQERSFKIELAVSDDKLMTAEFVAEDLKAQFAQDSVMVTYPNGEVKFI